MEPETASKSEEKTTEEEITLDGLLPLEVCIMVLARLPLPYMIRLRLLSRSWNKMLHSRYWLENIIKLQRSISNWDVDEECLVMMMTTKRSENPGQEEEEGKLLFFWPSLKKWFTFPFYLNPSLVSHLGRAFSNVAIGYDYTPIIPNVPVDAFGGIVYIIVDDDKILAFNPLTGSHRFIPPQSPHEQSKDTNPFRSKDPVDRNSLFIKLVEDCEMEGAYYILVKNQSMPSEHSIVYSSRMGSWMNLEDFLGSEDILRNHDNLFEHIVSTHYFEQGDMGRTEEALIMFNFKMFEFASATIKTGDSVRSASASHVFNWNRSVYFAVSIEEALPQSMGYKILKGFQLCQLQEVYDRYNDCKWFKWVEIKRTPQKFWGRVSSNFESRFTVTGNLLCLTTIHRPKPKPQPHHDMPYTIVYDLVRQVWYLLPKTDKGGTTFLTSFSVTPSLFAEP